jgi:starvation-inducible DNA-binding protein
VARTARALMPLVDKASDEPTADLITLPRQIHENNAWMLCSLLEE